MVLSQGAPLRSRVRLRLPALSFWPGHRPDQAIKCPAVAKRLMSAADFGEDRERRHLADPGDRLEQTDQVGKSGFVSPRLRVHARHPGVDFVVDDPDRRAESVPLAEMEPEKEAVMVGQPPMQRIV